MGEDKIPDSEKHKKEGSIIRRLGEDAQAVVEAIIDGLAAKYDVMKVIMGISKAQSQHLEPKNDKFVNMVKEGNDKEKSFAQKAKEEKVASKGKDEGKGSGV